MSSKQTIRLVLTVAIVFMTVLLGVSLPSIHPVFAASLPVYVSCDANTGGFSLIPQSSCAWTPAAVSPNLAPTPPGNALFGQGGGGVIDINAGDGVTSPPQV